MLATTGSIQGVASMLCTPSDSVVVRLGSKLKYWVSWSLACDPSKLTVSTSLEICSVAGNHPRSTHTIQSTAAQLYHDHFYPESTVCLYLSLTAFNLTDTACFVFSSFLLGKSSPISLASSELDGSCWFRLWKNYTSTPCRS